MGSNERNEAMSTTQISTTNQTRDEHKAGFGIYLAFIPWVLFTLIAQHSTLKMAGIAALGASAAIALPSLLKGRPKLLELGAILAFASSTKGAIETLTRAWAAEFGPLESASTRSRQE